MRIQEIRRGRLVLALAAAALTAGVSRADAADAQAPAVRVPFCQFSRRKVRSSGKNS